MDIGRSFTFITEDEDWLRKVLIGGLISLIPIVGQLYMAGYVIQVIRNTIEGREVPLPEVTEDFGEKLLKGLMAMLIAVIYFIPVIIVASISGVGSALLSSAVADTEAAETVGSVMALWGSLLWLHHLCVEPRHQPAFALCLGQVCRDGAVWRRL